LRLNFVLVGTYFSGDGQDFYLSSLLFNYVRNHPGAWIIDVGANDPEFLSNSLYFETYYACRTLAIDPLEEFRGVWKKTRPGAIFVAAALGSEEGSTELMIPTDGDDMFSSVVGGVQELRDMAFDKRVVPLKRLGTIMGEHGIRSAMLLSIDVEGFEMEVLKGIDFDKVEIKAIVLGNNSTGLTGSNNVREFLRKENYVFVARLCDADDVFLHQSMINGFPAWLRQPATTI